MAKNSDSFIKLYRKSMENPLYFNEPFDKWHAFQDLLLLANFADTETIFNGKVQIIKRGQVQTSYEWLAKRWHWSRNKVVRYTKMLKKLKMCDTNGTTDGTTITIENYDKYQSKRTTNGTANELSDEPAGGTQNKNNNKECIKNTLKGDENEFDIDAEIEKYIDRTGE